MLKNLALQAIMLPLLLILNSMAQRSTRNKIRFQADSAFDNLRKAQIHLTQLAALADDQSNYINENLPVLIAGLDTVITAVDRFSEKL